MNPASEYVEASRDRSPVHRYVADHGQGVAKEDIEHRGIAGEQVAVSTDLTTDDRTLIKNAIQATKPAPRMCFANALNMWLFNDRFTYTEGFAVMSDFDVGGIEHAWCLLDGETLVDITEPFDHYHGTTVSDPDVLDQYTRPDFIDSGIIGNHHNRYEFLRERGYTKYE